MHLTEVFFATSNEHKFNEIKLAASKHGIAIKLLREKPFEIQSDRLEEIARQSLIQVLTKTDLPVFVEDAGLFIKALNGFPGPYSSYVFRTVGCEGVLKLLNDVKDRSAFFFSAVAYGKLGVEPIIFTGQVRGVITFESRGAGGFGFDPIFLPFDSLKTFSEMTTDEKNFFSHRAKAIRKLFESLSF